MKTLEDVLAEYHPYTNPSQIWKRMLEEKKKARTGKIIVLDDDPTGTQTVHGVPVYTDWREETIQDLFKEKESTCYILTNSRSLTEPETANLHWQIAQRIGKTAQRFQEKFLLISRGDSTLRGHYPLETETLKNGIEEISGYQFDGEILCPFFLEGGRFTVEDIHYVMENGKLIPAAETEFAKDSTFGYKNSNLRKYIEEKTEGKIHSDQVLSISVQELRNQNITQIREKLLHVSGFQRIIVNALCDEDLEVFCTACFGAIAEGKHYLFRTAASMVRILSGIEKRKLLNSFAMSNLDKGGLIVIGSYTEKTTEQLRALKGMSGLEFEELVVTDQDIQKKGVMLACQCSEKICAGITPVIYTSREIVRGINKEQSLLRSVEISNALQSIVAGLWTEPAYILAKGGITSSDIVTKAMQVKKAFVEGQIAPGVPVWIAGEESKFPNIPYVIFPGNVGQLNTLRDVILILEKNRKAGKKDDDWNCVYGNDLGISSGCRG